VANSVVISDSPLINCIPDSFGSKSAYNFNFTFIAAVNYLDIRFLAAGIQVVIQIMGSIGILRKRLSVCHLSGVFQPA